DNAPVAAQSGRDGAAAEGRDSHVAGNQPTAHRYHLNALPAAHTRRLPLLLSLLLAALDITMLSLAFILSYEARNVLTLFARPVNPPTLETYIPTMALHVALIFI